MQRRRASWATERAVTDERSIVVSVLLFSCIRYDGHVGGLSVTGFASAPSWCSRRIVVGCSPYTVCAHVREHGFPLLMLQFFGVTMCYSRRVPRCILPFKSGLTACTRVQPSEM
jgi:hypothetical protein